MSPGKQTLKKHRKYIIITRSEDRSVWFRKFLVKFTTANWMLKTSAGLTRDRRGPSGGLG